MTLRSLDGFTARLLALYAGAFAVTLVIIWKLTGGHFSYSLDDPYIHLALAQNIARGHYGINPGENTSPASSVVWPLLLAPFSSSAYLAWVPLGFNVLFSVVVCWLLGGFFQRSYLRLHPGLGPIQQWLFALLFLLAANLIGLTFIGMEHVLQLVLVIGCALGILEAYEGRRISSAYLVMAALAPIVRYEDLAFTAGLALACFLQGRRKAAFLTLAASLVPLAAFSAFLHRLGLAYLPNSVLVKGEISERRASAVQRVIALLHEHVHVYAINPSAWPIELFALGIAIYVLISHRHAVRMRALISALLPVLLMIFIGPYGWFYRYDVCVRLFSFLILFAVLAKERTFPLARTGVLALMAASVYVLPLVRTPFAAQKIAFQQEQMARFAHDFYKKPIAVNDLGWVSFNKNEHQYVLDLWGLASSEAIVPLASKNEAWLDAITRRHDVGLVMLYPGWFKNVPQTWQPMAELHMRDSRLDPAIGARVVMFYATPLADKGELREELTAFASSMPKGSWITVPSP